MRLRCSLTLAVAVATVGCSITPQPVVAPLAARTWNFPAGTTFASVVAVARATAPDKGYAVAEEPSALFLRSSRFYASEIDRYCIYPIINAKTGGRMRTFAAWQVEMNRLASHHGRAFGIVEVQIRDQEPLRAITFCRALTELKLQPAESTGVYERELMGLLGIGG